MIFTSVYLIVRSVPGLLAMRFRRDLSKDAELLVLRHRNVVLRRRVARPGPPRACGRWRWPATIRDGATGAFVADIRIVTSGYFPSSQHYRR